MTVIQLSSAPPTAAALEHPSRLGVSLSLGARAGTSISPLWTLGGWRLQFVRLAAGRTLQMDRAPGALYVKVILGALSDPPRRAYPPVGTVTSTRLDSDTITAGGDGALVSVFQESAAVPPVLSSVMQLTVAGPLAEAFGWQTFEERYGELTPFFHGVDAHLLPGFHLLDDDGAEIAYVFFWIAGKGVDLSTHNHDNRPSDLAPAFAEVHQVLNNGTGDGGMYVTPEPRAPERTRLPLQRGEEHGPFFALDTATGKARLRENGAVEYPWHGWQAGQDARSGQSYDLVCAYEITAPYSFVS
jgi:hypothetical protein